MSPIWEVSDYARTHCDHGRSVNEACDLCELDEEEPSYNLDSYDMTEI